MMSRSQFTKVTHAANALSTDGLVVLEDGEQFKADKYILNIKLWEIGGRAYFSSDLELFGFFR